MKSFWAKTGDGTTQLCIIRVIRTSWEERGLLSPPSTSGERDLGGGEEMITMQMFCCNITVIVSFYFEGEKYC